MTHTLDKKLHTQENCRASLFAVRDALDVLNGKWKLPLIVSLSAGPKRFSEIQRDIGTITPKVLSKELRDLEINDFVVRKVVDTIPVTITYALTPYSESLDEIIEALRRWGLQHRQRMIESMRAEVSV